MLNYFPQVPALIADESRSRTKGETVVSIGNQRSIRIVVPQPIKMDDLNLLEPGERVSNWRVTWSESILEPGQELEYKSKKYRIIQVNEREEGGFYRAVMCEKVGTVA